MSSRDAGFLYLERRHAPLHIGCLAILEQPVAFGALTAHLESRLGRTRRYRQRILAVPFDAGHPTWEDDPEFDLRNHLHRWALPEPGGPTELCEAAADLFAQPLDRERPLWEMHLLEGLDGGRCALLQKVHHCMVDGVAGAQLLEVLLEPSPAPFERPPEAPRIEPLPARPVRLGRAIRDGIGRAGLVGLGIAATLARPVAARAAVDRLRNAAFASVRLASSQLPDLPWNGPLGPRRRLVFTRLPLGTVRRIRKVGGGTVNDVVLCMIAGGLHRYLAGMGISTQGLEVTALVPVSLRPPGDSASLGNRISALLVPLAVDLEAEGARLAATCALTDRLKANAAWVGIDALLSLVDELPAGLVALAVRRLGGLRIANLVATNVPGPREARFLGPTRVSEIHPIVPIVDGIGLGVAVFSYDGWLHVGLNAEADMVSDLDKLRQGIEAAFSVLARDVGAGLTKRTA